MRNISYKTIEKNIRDMCIISNITLPEDLAELIKKSADEEKDELAAGIMNDLLRNLDAATELGIPVCQDTGITVIFAEIGQEVHFTGGSFENAVNSGVAAGYTEGNLRSSVVGDPFLRNNTGNNTPAIIHTRIVPGDRIKLTVAPKGFGSENMSKICMFNPSESRENIIKFIVDTVETAGSYSCPPMVIGVGIGGNFEYCAYLSKKALCRNVSERNSNEYYREMETEILNRINLLNIGPQGFGGKTTALSVAVEEAPTHIAGMPVAVNIGCHVTRHYTVIL